MELYSENEHYKLYHGSMLDMLEVINKNSIDSIVTDPPYELGFMNKGWDSSGIAFQKETWEKCFEVLKPGGYLLAFGGSRTFHRIATAIEDAGFEIRDTIMWLYGSGFPKSMNIGKAVESKLVNGSANTQAFKDLKGTKAESGDWGLSANSEFYGARPSDYSADKHLRTVNVDYQTDEGQKWDGWGTALKPSYEPIIVARKPCEGSTTDNVLKWQVGGLNIDACRISTNDKWQRKEAETNTAEGYQRKNSSMFAQKTAGEMNENGRFPANTILTFDDSDFDEVCGGFPYTSSNGGETTMQDFRDVGKKSKESIGIDKLSFGQVNNAERINTGYVSPCDSGSAARYFYCAKASTKDRDEGLNDFEKHIESDIKSLESAKMPHNRSGNAKKNTHPTVKPTELMQYLIRLVTPAGGRILDPFNGSGSTGKAAMWENRERDTDYSYIGIELTEQYLPIAAARIEYPLVAPYDEFVGDNNQLEGQLSLFDIM